MDPGEKRTLLSRATIFAGLQSRQLDALASAARIEKVRAKTELFHKGDPGRQLYVVARGRLKALTTSKDGDDVVVSIIGPGEVIGEIAILGEIERTLTVRTLEASELLVLDRRDLLSLLRSEPDLCLAMLVLVARRVRDQIEMFEEVHFLNLPYRLARKFDSLSRIYGERCDSGLRIDLKLSQEEWGDTVGATREAVNKQLRTWTREGLLSIEGGYVVLCRPEQIARLAQRVPL